METTSHRALARETSSEERRETGLSLIIIGFMLWFFDVLISFFLPAGVRLGHERAFVILIGSVFVGGLVLMGIGSYLRKE